MELNEMQWNFSFINHVDDTILTATLLLLLWVLHRSGEEITCQVFQGCKFSVIGVDIGAMGFRPDWLLDLEWMHSV